MILGMGERGLTPRQRKFAELLASGSSKVDSFRAAYPSDKRSRATEWQGGKRVARLPQVRAGVERCGPDKRGFHNVVAAVLNCLIQFHSNSVVNRAKSSLETPI